jgi:hypothetical protein
VVLVVGWMEVVTVRAYKWVLCSVGDTGRDSRQQQKKHAMPPAPAVLSPPDELTRYLEESPVAKSYYNGDPLV